MVNFGEFEHSLMSINVIIFVTRKCYENNGFGVRTCYLYEQNLVGSVSFTVINDVFLIFLTSR